jgi:hypothetical protein
MKWKRLSTRRGISSLHAMMMYLGMYSKLLGENGLKLMTQLIISVYINGVWPTNFIEVTMIALKKKPKLQNAMTITKSASSHIQQR